jgi:hypothetical protein
MYYWINYQMKLRLLTRIYSGFPARRALPFYRKQGKDSNMHHIYGIQVE